MCERPPPQHNHDNRLAQIHKSFLLAPLEPCFSVVEEMFAGFVVVPLCSALLCLLHFNVHILNMKAD